MTPRTKTPPSFKSLLLAAALVLVLASPHLAAQDLKTVLTKLDAASANFHTVSADFQFDSLVTDPVPDKTVQKGVVYYSRRGSDFQIGAHINEENSKPVPKVYTYAKGVFRLYEKLVNQVTTYKNDKLSEYLLLGFGASGKELAKTWNITYSGQEKINGVTTDKLELVPKDPSARKNLPKVTVWMDTPHAVSLKQIFDQGEGQSRICVYTNFKFNQSLPSDAFNFKTDSKTTFVNR
ncbi:LolA family protein [Occallatibacter savannae]|uniref:LolA family protein n=1 Tax=Occallatibacter savannae TaxID=1002691 RepID=UPI000D699D3B|nr:hypothetical protein [Occallatibacter savannae]